MEVAKILVWLRFISVLWVFSNLAWFGFGQFLRHMTQSIKDINPGCLRCMTVNSGFLSKHLFPKISE